LLASVDNWQAKAKDICPLHTARHECSKIQETIIIEPYAVAEGCRYWIIIFNDML